MKYDYGWTDLIDWPDPINKFDVDGFMNDIKVLNADISIFDVKFSGGSVIAGTMSYIKMTDTNESICFYSNKKGVDDIFARDPDYEMRTLVVMDIDAIGEYKEDIILQYSYPVKKTIRLNDYLNRKEPAKRFKTDGPLTKGSLIKFYLGYKESGGVYKRIESTGFVLKLKPNVFSISYYDTYYSTMLTLVLWPDTVDHFEWSEIRGINHE